MIFYLKPNKQRSGHGSLDLIWIWNWRCAKIFQQLPDGRLSWKLNFKLKLRWVAILWDGRTRRTTCANSTIINNWYEYNIIRPLGSVGWIPRNSRGPHTVTARFGWLMKSWKTINYKLNAQFSKQNKHKWAGASFVLCFPCFVYRAIGFPWV